MPKPTKPLTYPARDNSPSAPEATPSSPLGSPKKSTKPKSPGKKRKLPPKSSAAAAAHESKRPKLFTLRASRSEYSDEEETEGQWDEEQQPECSSVREGSAFVPASLRSPHLLMSEVEEVGIPVNINVFFFFYFNIVTCIHPLILFSKILPYVSFVHGFTFHNSNPSLSLPSSPDK